MKKKSVVLFGHSTSVSLENEFWNALQRIANERNVSVAGLIAEIDKTRTTNLSSAIRVFILNTFIKTHTTGTTPAPGDKP